MSMEMGNKPEKQISCLLHLFRTSLLCVAAVSVLSLLFTCFLILGVSAFLITACILFLSTIFIVKLSKKKVPIVDNSAEDENPIYCPESILGKEVKEKLNPEVENAINPEEVEPVIQCSASQQSDGCPMMHEYEVEPIDFPSDSESSDEFSASGNLEFSWRCSNNVGQNIQVSESSISEEEDEDEEEEDEDGDGLIEISLPQNNSVEFNEEPKKKSSQSNLPDYLAESIFMQQGLMELFSEINGVNEEENLIEIDPFMGSIK